MDVDLSVVFAAVGVSIAGFAVFQNYSHKKLSLEMENRIKRLEDDRDSFRTELVSAKEKVEEVQARISSLESEVTSLKESVKNLISKSESLASQFSHLDQRIQNHEEKLLKMARSVATNAAAEATARVVQVELAAATQTIKYVEQSVNQIRSELKESARRAELDLEF